LIDFTVNVNPMGAVRMTQRGKWKSDSAQRYLAYKSQIGFEARKHIKTPLSGPVHAVIRFYYPIPSRFNKLQKEKARNGELAPVVKPDLDNCVKGIFDALNKIAWNDDNQVIAASASKLYSDQPRIEIRIFEVKAA